MLLNNLDPEVAEHPEELVVYGGSGRAARSHQALRDIVRTLLRLVTTRRCSSSRGSPSASSGRTPARPAFSSRTPCSSRSWATWDEFRRLEAEGLTMFGQMTAGSWIYIGTQGILQGTYQTFCAAGEVHFGSADLAGGRCSLRGSAGWGAHSRSRRRWRARRFSASRSTSARSTGGSRRGTSTSRPARSTTRVARVRAAAAERRPLSVALLGNAADVFPELVARGERFDLVTDQTAAHDPLTGYVPAEVPFEEAAALRARDPKRYLELASQSIVTHVRAMCDFVRMGCYVFDYGNNLRGEAYAGGLSDAFSYPGFVPAYIRPLFCRGIGPFRWAVLSGDPADIASIDRELQGLFPDDVLLQRWLAMAPEKVAFQGLPARICWLGYGDRAKAGLAINELVRDRPRLGARRDRPRSPRLRIGRLALPRDRGDAGRLRRDRRLADPQRAPQHGRGRDVGQRPPRRRGRHRQLDPQRAWSCSRTGPPTQPTGSSACSPPTPERA